MKKKYILLFLILLLIPVAKIKALGINCISHVQDYGWMSRVSNAQVCGTTGKAKRMEAMYLAIDDPGVYNKIIYQAHVEDYGWLNWVKGGDLAGTSGKAKRMEAIRIKLDDSLTAQYSVYYRAHVEDYGWMGWVKNGELAGTTGQAKRMEAIEVKLVQNENYVPPAAEPEPTPVEPETPVEPDVEAAEPEIVYPHISYSIHNSNGWSNYIEDGEVLGDIENPIPFDLMKIKLDNSTGVNGNISYQTFTTNNDWSEASTNDVQNGIQNNNIEAIKLSLTGDLANNYDIFYKVYVHNLGWLDWTNNGNVTGTKGYFYPIEAIQVQLQEKNTEGLIVGQNIYKETSSKIKYSAHVSNIGWQKYVNDGEVVGEIVKRYSVEAIKISLESGISGDIEYKTYVARRGWTEPSTNNNTSGTEGLARKIEAIQISLTGEIAQYYDIYYRTNVSLVGWLGWAKNGEPSGCLNTNQEVDGIQIKLVPKGQPFDVTTAKSFLTGHWINDGKTYINAFDNITTGFSLIDGVKYYFNSDGILKGSNVKKVIDVSSWQENIDWDTIKREEDVDAVILRIGWGSFYDDPSGEDSQFAKNLAAVNRLGIPYSVYIYAYANTYLGTEVEAKFISDTFAKYNIPKDTFVWYDAEITSTSRDIYSQIIPHFFNKLTEYGINNYGLYAGVRQLDTTNGNLNTATLRSYPIWVAQYYKNLQYTGEYVGWQFSSTEYINGINGYVDVSMFK